jgi:ATP-dependent Clp protease protease subunit
MGERERSSTGDRERDWPWLPAPVPAPDGADEPRGYGRESLSEALTRRLLEQRVVLLHGPLDDLTVTRVSAELMTLDADGDDPVSLRVDCGEAALAQALTLMDVIELMGVPVHALCLGQVAGGAIGVVALCAHRAAMPSTRFSVCEPTTQMEAHVRNVAQWAELRAAERLRFCERVGAAVGKPAEVIGEDLTRGLFLGAAEAVQYGLIDEVSRPDAPIRRLPGPGPAPMGFRPLR